MIKEIDEALGFLFGSGGGSGCGGFPGAGAACPHPRRTEAPR